MALTRQINRRKRLMSEINVVPYIDVMLVLLVIFIMTAPLLQQGVKVDLPRTHSKTLETKAVAPIIISVDRQGHYTLNGEKQGGSVPLTMSQLIIAVKARLGQATPQGDRPMVLVAGDRVVHYGQVIALMARLQQAGIQRVGLITTPSTDFAGRR